MPHPRYPLVRPARTSRGASALFGLNPLLLGAFLLLFGKEDIPPGGPCRFCIDGALKFNDKILWLCVRSDTNYLGRDPTTKDDRKFVDILTNNGGDAPAWDMVLTGDAVREVAKCDSCSARVVEPAKYPPDMSVNSYGTLVEVEVEGLGQMKASKSAKLAITLKVGPEGPENPLTDLTFSLTTNPSDFTCAPVGPTKVEKPMAQYMGQDVQANQQQWKGAGTGGQPQDPPYVAYITFPSTFGGQRVCSGVLVADNAVLTAAHCFIDEFPKPSNVQVIIGTSAPLKVINDSSTSASEKRYTAKAIDVHPQYKESNTSPQWDLAIVTLGRKVGSAQALPKVSYAIPKHSSCKLVSYGFGVIANARQWKIFPFYDHGVLVPRSLVPYDEPDSCLTVNMFQCAAPTRLLALQLDSTVTDHYGEICRGNSGGAIISHCEDGAHLLGVLAARSGKSLANDLVAMPPSQNGQSPPKATDLAFEKLAAPVAFSQGNYCGHASTADGVLGTRVDEAWISGVLNRQNLHDALIK